MCYSTGNITVRNIEGASEQGEIAVTVSGTWNLTKDSCVDNVIVNDGGVINRNRFQLKTKE